MGLWEGQRKMFSNKLFTVSQSLLGRLLLCLPRTARSFFPPHPQAQFLTSREQGRAGLHSGLGVRNGSVCVCVWWGEPDTGTPV